MRERRGSTPRSCPSSRWRTRILAKKITGKTRIVYLSGGCPRLLRPEKPRAVAATELEGLDHLVGGGEIPRRHRHRPRRTHVQLPATAWKIAQMPRQQHQRAPAFRNRGQGHVLDQAAVERRMAVAEGDGKDRWGGGGTGRSRARVPPACRNRAP